MMQAPQDYKVSQALVRRSIKAFYSILWKPQDKKLGAKLKVIYCC
jgi:hypothetical protein